MLVEPGHIENWLVEEWTARLASAIESMAGERPAVSLGPFSAAPEPAQPAQVWRQALPPLAGCVWIVAADGRAAAVGGRILRALGVEDSAEAEQESTFQEVLNQAFAELSQELAVRLKREMKPSGGIEIRPAAFQQARWTAITLTWGDDALGENTLGEQVVGDNSVTLLIGLEAALTEALQSAEFPPAPAVEPAAQPASAAAAQRSAADSSKTFALLLEVELPVAVSFGRAQIPLKDALKLTTGSIVELNRAVTEPVEIIVNNCVIARGEVVVVEGNFGVRIQEVMNRQDRLRTVQ